MKADPGTTRAARAILAAMGAAVATEDAGTEDAGAEA
jgi:hypothetical protein